MIIALSSDVLIGDDSAAILAWKKLPVKAGKGRDPVEYHPFLCYNVSTYPRVMQTNDNVHEGADNR